jgi:multiple sugar transport system substrate-binding protein
MKKTLILRHYFIFNIVVVLFFVGCHSQKPKKTTLNFSVWGTPEQIRVEKRIIRRYEQENPNIKINLLSFQASSYRRKLMTMAAAGMAPDIMMMTYNHMFPMADKGALLDMTQILEKKKFDRKKYFDLTWKAFSWENRIYGLPRDVSGTVMYYNESALQKQGMSVPETWSEFARACRKLTQDNNQDGILDQYGSSIGIPQYMMYLWCYGGDLLDNVHAPRKSVFNSSEALQTLSYFEKLYKMKGITPPQFNSENSADSAFMSGATVFYFNGKWMTPSLKKIRNFNWDVARPPKGPMGHFTSHGGTCFAVSSTSKFPKEAVSFTMYYTGEIGTAIAVRGGRTTPTIKHMANSPLFLEQHPPENTKVFVWTMLPSHGRNVLYHPRAEEIYEPVRGELEKLALGTLSITNIQYNLHTRINAVLKDF